MRPSFLPALILGLVLGSMLGGAAVLAQTDTQPAAGAEGGQGVGHAGGAAATPEFGIDTVLADVDGTRLTVGDLVAIRRELPQQYQQLPDEMLFNAILDQLTDQILLARAAEAAGLDKKPAIALRILNQDRAILAEAYLNRELARRVTRDDAEALYMERYVKGEPVEEVRAAHILVATKEKAEEIKAKIDAGADFAALAKQYGTDATAKNGGELGWFVHDEMVAPFADAAFAMKPGTISEPVKTDFGWHLIKLEDRRVRKAPPFEKVEAKLMEELRLKAQDAVLAELRAKAHITRPETMPPAASIRADKMLDAAQ